MKIANPCLKTLPHIDPKLLGRLLEPETPMYGDQEMYQAVRQFGLAVVNVYNDDSVRTYSPDEFQKLWCGD